MSSKPRTANSNIRGGYMNSRVSNLGEERTGEKRRVHGKKEARFMSVFSIDELTFTIFL